MNEIDLLNRLSAYYLVGIPIGLLFAFHKSFQLGLAGLWLGIAICLVYCAAVGVWICLRADWDHEVLIVGKRLRAAQNAARKLAIGDEESDSSVEDSEYERTLGSEEEDTDETEKV